LKVCIERLEEDKVELFGKYTKSEENVLELKKQLDALKAQKKENEDKLMAKLKEKDTEQSIIISNYDDKIKVYK